MGLFGQKSLLVLPVALATLASFSSCSPHRDPPKKTLAQEIEELDSTAFHLCRLNYSYPLSGTQSLISAYIAKSGNDRDELRREILEECVKLPAEKAAGCSKADLINNLTCSHIDAIAKFAASDGTDLVPGNVFQCSVNSNWRYAGQEYDHFSTFIMKDGETKSQAIRSIIEACMILPELEREGCSHKLVQADLRCIQTKESN